MANSSKSKADDAVIHIETGTSKDVANSSKSKADDAVINIETLLRDLSPTPSEHCIFKVPKELRMVNEKAYKPEIVSIGPYHRNKGDHLKTMEEHKARYLQALLQRKNELSVATLVQAMSELEVRARRCYAEPTNDVAEGVFLEMLVLDGCFLVELIRKFSIKRLRDDGDPIFKMEMITCRLKRDMILLENQLPFFVLWKLFEMTETRYQENCFLHMIFEFFCEVFPAGYVRENRYSNPPHEIDHLLGLLHNNCLPRPSVMGAYKRSSTETKRLITMRCATELKEAGIEFKKAEGPVLFDIKFEKSTLIIPKLSIDDATDSRFRNLIAYEQFSTSETDPDHIMDYTTFMDYLISSPKDVELLCRRGIIENCMGSDDYVANLFNRMGDGVIHSRNFIYHDIVERVNTHCEKRWNRHLAKLRHDYFNSPWALISFLAALLLLSLAIAQTVFSVLSFCKQN